MTNIPCKSRIAKFVLCLTALWASLGGECNPAIASETVAVYVRDGRILAGNVDSRTSQDELWLHSAEPSILILSSISWSEVVGAKIAERKLTTAEFRQLVEKLKSPIPQMVFQKRPLMNRPMLTPGTDDSQGISATVRSLQILPELANWNSDGASDGLELRVMPLTASRTTTAVQGMINVRLLARRMGTSDRLESRNGFGFWRDGGSVREYANRLDNSRYIEVARWSERLTLAESRFSGYVLQLPFRQIHPEFDLDVGFDGMVEAHLSVNGQGVYNATAPIQLRTFSPLREELQRDRGTRYFPDER